jgi:hypothetical protein
MSLELEFVLEELFVNSESTPDSSPGEYYNVKQGDNLSLIALVFGFKDHTTIYNHPNNADFKKQRPNPDILFPGDMVFIPKPVVKEQPCATDQRWTFVLRRPKKVLRIVVEDFEGKPMANAAYQLTLQGTDQVRAGSRVRTRRRWKAPPMATGVSSTPCLSMPGAARFPLVVSSGTSRLAI